MHRRRPFRVAVVTFLLAMAATSGGAVSARDGSVSPGTTAAPSSVYGAPPRHPREGAPCPRQDGRGDEPHVERAADPPARQPSVCRCTVAPARAQPACRRSAPGRGHADGQPGRRRPARVRRVVAEQRAGHQRRAAGSDPRRRTRSRHADPEQLVPDDRSRRQRPRRRVAGRLRRHVRIRRSRFARVVRPPRHLRQPPRPLADDDGRPDVRRDCDRRRRDRVPLLRDLRHVRSDRLLDRELLLRRRLPDRLPGARDIQRQVRVRGELLRHGHGGCLPGNVYSGARGPGHRLGGLARSGQRLRVQERAPDGPDHFTPRVAVQVPATEPEACRSSSSTPRTGRTWTSSTSRSPDRWPPRPRSPARAST